MSDKLKHYDIEYNRLMFELYLRNSIWQTSLIDGKTYYHCYIQFDDVISEQSL